MSILSRLFGPCAFSHAAEPLMVMHGTQARRECRRCLTDLGPWISGQMYPVRPLKKLAAKVVEQKSAHVLKPTWKVR